MQSVGRRLLPEAEQSGIGPSDVVQLTIPRVDVDPVGHPTGTDTTAPQWISRIGQFPRLDMGI